MYVNTDLSGVLGSNWSVCIEGEGQYNKDY